MTRTGLAARRRVLRHAVGLSTEEILGVADELAEELERIADAFDQVGIHRTDGQAIELRDQAEALAGCYLELSQQVAPDDPAAAEEE